MDNAMNDLWRAQQDAAARAAGSWLELLRAGARTPAPPAADDRAQPLAGTDAGAEETPGDTAADEPTPEAADREAAALEALAAIRAIQNLGEGQRDFAEHMTHWADLQRDLADSMTAWAKQQRQYADALDRLLAPFGARDGSA